MITKPIPSTAIGKEWAYFFPRNQLLRCPAIQAHLLPSRYSLGNPICRTSSAYRGSSRIESKSGSTRICNSPGSCGSAQLPGLRRQRNQHHCRNRLRRRHLGYRAQRRLSPRHARSSRLPWPIRPTSLTAASNHGSLTAPGFLPRTQARSALGSVRHC